jgi:hypothetical protein
MRKDAFDKKFSETDPKTRFIVNQAVTTEDAIVFGIQCVVIKDFSTAGGDSLWDQIELPKPEDDEEDDDHYGVVSSCINDFIAGFEPDECSSFCVSDGG